MSESDRLVYYEKAMKAGLNSRLQVPFFTTVGKMRVREALKKNNDETNGKFHILGGGVSAEGHFPYVITKDLKCTESHFEHF